MIHFKELNAPRPNINDIADESSAILDKIQSSKQLDDVLNSMKQWDQQRREVGTYLALVYLRFTQNTADEQAKSEKDKAGMERDLQEARGGLEEAMRDRANMEKNCKMS